MKERCALKAVEYIKDGMTVGLGGGSTISYLVKFINEKKLNVKVVTPSFNTAKLCVENNLTLLPVWSVDHLDIAFDGCDEVDLKLNALKSGGAIHTKEKIIASMADQYVLLVDESKVFEKLPFDHSITLEVIKEAISYVTKQIESLGGKVTLRISGAKDGFTVSDHGNVIMEAKFDQVENIALLDQQLNKITGIIDTSLFVNQATMVLSVDDSHVRIIGGK
ncbi:ribose 5-phosphate isomerase A [Thomasclavelia sp.]|uniref:ribose 5-phosphate isomerase A n=1 Tax=Thomasclavelia sp. TaxID=3025757 RepID=UPI0025F46A7C|nr:ribose 5-phosphate isomerase A [Thomasclavelia sp.]